VNGSIGTDMVVRAPADGYTFLLVDRLTVSVNPLLYKLSYDPRKDLVPVSNIADVSLYLVVSSALPVSDYRSFVSYLKANPGKVNLGVCRDTGKNDTHAPAPEDRTLRSGKKRRLLAWAVGERLQRITPNCATPPEPQTDPPPASRGARRPRAGTLMSWRVTSGAGYRAQS
jgi:hypothetical protein